MQTNYIIGTAGINQYLVDDAVSYLNHHCKLDSENMDVRHECKAEFCIPSYITQTHQNGTRFYFSKTYNISKLDPSIPSENLLFGLSKRISELGFSFDSVELRFEKGCFNPQIEWWHQDFSNYDGHMAISLCYSNVINWSTKILDQSAMDKIGTIPKGVIDSTILEKIETLATSSDWGVFYNVKELYHRSPTSKDCTSPLHEDDYRIFIRFNKF